MLYKYNYTCVLQFVMKTSAIYCTAFCGRDDKYAHEYSHGNNLHALKTWSECMHMHARKTCKQWSKYNCTCVLQFVMKTSAIYCTVFCAPDDKNAHDYSHGNNLHAPKHGVNAFTGNMHGMMNVYLWCVAASVLSSIISSNSFTIIKCCTYRCRRIITCHGIQMTKCHVSGNLCFLFLLSQNTKRQQV